MESAFDRFSKQQIVSIGHNVGISRFIHLNGQIMVFANEVYSLDRESLVLNRVDDQPKDLDDKQPCIALSSGFCFPSHMVIGDQSVFYLYEEGLWTPMFLNIKQRRFQNMIYLAKQNIVMISGGVDKDGAMCSTVELLNVFSGDVEQLTTNVPINLLNHLSVCLPDGTVCMLGGLTENGSENRKILFVNPETGSVKVVKMEYPPFDDSGFTSIAELEGNVIACNDKGIWMLDVTHHIWMELKVNSVASQDKWAFMIAAPKHVQLFDARMSTKVDAWYSDSYSFMDKIVDMNLESKFYDPMNKDFLAEQLKLLSNLEGAENNLRKIYREYGCEIDEYWKDAQYLDRSQLNIQMRMMNIKPGKVDRTKQDVEGSVFGVLTNLEEYKTETGSQIEELEHKIKKLSDNIAGYNQLVIRDPQILQDIQCRIQMQEDTVNYERLANQLLEQEQEVIKLTKKQKVKSKQIGSQYSSIARICQRIDQASEQIRVIREKTREKQREFLRARIARNNSTYEEMFGDIAPCDEEAKKKREIVDEYISLKNETDTLRREIEMKRRTKNASMTTIYKDIVSIVKGEDKTKMEKSRCCKDLRGELGKLKGWVDGSARLIDDESFVGAITFDDLFTRAVQKPMKGGLNTSNFLKKLEEARMNGPRREAEIAELEASKATIESFITENEDALNKEFM